MNSSICESYSVQAKQTAREQTSTMNNLQAELAQAKQAHAAEKYNLEARIRPNNNNIYARPAPCGAEPTFAGALAPMNYIDFSELTILNANIGAGGFGKAALGM